MTIKAQAGNNRRCKRWRVTHKKAYNEYMKRYMAAKRRSK